MKKIYLSSRDRIKNRIRSKVSGTAERPRLTVFKSNKAIYAQLIDDMTGTTLAQANSSAMKDTKMNSATKVGQELAKAAKAKNITKVVFDRNGYIFTGRVLALADAAREAGLEF
ncbi:MAG: 50S ribosomal protein L18 [Patescibacteria group bacterium]